MLLKLSCFIAYTLNLLALTNKQLNAGFISVVNMRDVSLLHSCGVAPALSPRYFHFIHRIMCAL